MRVGVMRVTRHRSIVEEMNALPRSYPGAEIHSAIVPRVTRFCYLIIPTDRQRGRIAIIYGSHWNEPGGRYGDGSWAGPTNFGSSQFLFIEDNTFNCHLPPYVLPITDSYGGGRFVVRYNTIHDGMVGGHGTESTGRIRGVRAVEVYNNTYAGTNQN